MLGDRSGEASYKVHRQANMGIEIFERSSRSKAEIERSFSLGFLGKLKGSG